MYILPFGVLWFGLLYFLCCLSDNMYILRFAVGPLPALLLSFIYSLRPFYIIRGTRSCISENLHMFHLCPL